MVGTLYNIGTVRIRGGARTRGIGWVLLAVLCGLSAPVDATQSRLKAMGGNAQQITVVDDTNVLRFPHTLLLSPNLGVVEGDGRWDELDASFGNISAHVSLAEGMALGLHIGTHRRTQMSLDNRWNPYAFGYVPTMKARTPSWVRMYVDNGIKTGRQQAMEAIASSTDSTSSGFAHHASLTYAMNIVDGLDFGVRLGLLIDSDDSGSPQEEPLIWDVSTGVGFALGGGRVDVGAGVKVGPGGTQAEQRLGQELAADVTVRGEWTMRGGDSLRPFIQGVYTTPLTDSQPENTTRAAGVLVNVGTDYAFQLGENVRIQPGLGCAVARESVRWDPALDETSALIVSVFYHVAVEIQVTDWLDIRFGGSQELQTINADHGSGMIDGDTRGFETSETSVKHSVSSGIGLHLPAAFELDLQISSDWGHAGPAWASGGDSARLEASLAVSRRW